MPQNLRSTTAARRPTERMWPLDLGLIVVGGLVFYTVASRFRFDDPRWMYNAWTYVVLVPTTVIILSLIARSVASKFFEKSVQLGFLCSVFVHLLLLLMAVNVIIFTRYFPEAFTGNEPQRIPVRKTVPDYLFATPSKEMTQPDWSKPTDAETASKVVPIEQRSLPPVENSAERLQMPTEAIEQPVEVEKFLIPRKTPENSMPTPANTPGQKAKSLAQLDAESSPSLEPQKIETPDVQLEASASQAVDQRSVTDPSRTAEAVSAAMASTSLPPTPDIRPQSTPGAGRARPALEDRLPTIGNIASSTERVSPQQRDRSVQAAGAAPAPVTVAVSAFDQNADRMISRTELPTTRSSRAVGASISDASDAAPSQFSRPGVTAGATDRAALATASGMPSIEAGSGPEATSRRRTGKLGLPIAEGDSSTATSSLAADMAALGWSKTGSSANDSNADQAPADRLADSSGASRGQASTPRSSNATQGSAASLAMDIDLPLGVMGLSDAPVARSGVSVSMEPAPKIESLSLKPSERKRADVGGPVVPAGTEIASIESYRRRVMRTQGGAAPSPVGLVGPATEEAIERGLAFLSSRQLPQGHWSLQGHGENVILQSDTAATGLCLLAFQGAGYTHQQHQYASVVSRGLQALLSMQSPDGNLYRSENPISDQNVAFYSHGIAALALCEAFGMSGDEALREPAQRAVNYIVKSQHKERGGWRYQPQVSSDTSVSGWMMMALKSGELAGLDVPKTTYQGIERWLEIAKASRERSDRYRYNPYAPDTPAQRHGRDITPTMTAVGILMRMYGGWRRENPDMKSAADYIAQFPPTIGDAKSPQRDTYYWYYATQVMFHMGGEYWEKWNQKLNPILVDAQVKAGPQAGSWDPRKPIADRWSAHGGRLYLTAMNLLSLEVYYRHLPIYDDTAK
jgi:hypothetical protein